MLRTLSTDQVNEIADLANRVRFSEDELLRSAKIDRKGADDGLSKELDGSLLLETTVVPEALRTMREKLDAMEPDQRRELLAIMYIGRGEFTAQEWNSALEQAATVPEFFLTQRILEKTQLHDFLKKGLYELDSALIGADSRNPS